MLTRSRELCGGTFSCLTKTQLQWGPVAEHQPPPLEERLAQVMSIGQAKSAPNRLHRSWTLPTTPCFNLLKCGPRWAQRCRPPTLLARLGMPTSTPRLEPGSPPLSKDSNGVIRVGGTRVPLERVVYAWKSGESAEGITESYPVLALADVYAAIAYYLRHHEEVDAYIEEQDREADRVQEGMEKRFPPEGLRKKLLARLGR